jgi:hypothetical protein
VSWSDCLLSPVGCAVKKAGNDVAESAWESFLHWCAQGLSDMSATVFQAFSTSTAPTFDKPWWTKNLDLMIAVSLPILVAAFIAQCIAGVVRREPGYLARALVGALVGTAGVPVAIGLVSACGRATDEISLAILGNAVTADGYRRMTDIGIVLSAGTAGGFLLMAVVLSLIAMFSLYFVMLLREVALLAFVIFAPVALIGWTWSSTRHWLRRWAEVVGALLFSKVAMATVFTLGVSATGVQGAGSSATVGTFLTGALLMAIAALTPMVTFSFIHWAGDQGHAAAQAMQQGTQGVAAGRDHVQHAREWRAEHFGSRDNADAGIDGEVSDEAGHERPGQRAGQATAGDADTTRHAQSDDGRPSVSDPGTDSDPGRDGNDGGSGSVAVASASAVADGQGATRSGGEAGSVASRGTVPDGAADDDRAGRRDEQP